MFAANFTLVTIRKTATATQGVESVTGKLGVSDKQVSSGFLSVIVQR
jgi:hypothetical protein